jgi:hypothetical protein
MKMDYPSSDSDLDEEPPRRQGYQGYPHDEIDEASRTMLRRERENNLKFEETNPARAITSAKNAQSFAEKTEYFERRRERNNRIVGIKKGWILPNPANPAEVELARQREEKLDRKPEKYDPKRPLDQRWKQKQSKPGWLGWLGCQICEKVDTPLFHCAECKDSAYCSQRCQMEGCGEKHL